jgi:DNA-binding transcriptional MerR regulator
MVTRNQYPTPVSALDNRSTMRASIALNNGLIHPLGTTPLIGGSIERAVMEDHLSPAETAKRFGISIKALRLYEQRGLLTPLRTSNGSTGSAWRVYGPDQIARLHRILALKGMGLLLSQISEVLASTEVLDPILALQEQSLERDGERVAKALKLVRMARAKLASGKALSIDDLSNLTKETVMTQLPPETLKTLFQDVAPKLAPITAKHFNADARETMKSNAARLQSDLQDKIANFYAEASRLMAAGDPLSEATMNWARRWSAFRKDLVGDDPAVKSAIAGLEADTAIQDYLRDNAPDMDKLFTFMREAREHVEAQDK